jgi:hypothetical protein
MTTKLEAAQALLAFTVAMTGGMPHHKRLEIISQHYNTIRALLLEAANRPEDKTNFITGGKL